MNLDEARQTFIAESRELLDDMENALLSLDRQGPAAGGQPEAVNAIFRAAHTIKGSAGLFSLDHIVAFTHVLESVLDEVRAGAVATDGGLVSLLLSCCDHIGGMTDALEAGQTAGDAATRQRGAPLLQQLSAYLDGGAAHAGPRNGDGAGGGVDAAPAAVASAQWHLSLRIDPPGGAPASQAVLAPAALQAAVPPPADPGRDLLPCQGQGPAKPAEARTVRVDADKLDHLINLVGELIIAGASAGLIARRVQNAELQESTSRLSTLVEEVRDSALQLRMVKIGATFNRFQRVVHDVSRELGKDIGLLVNGEDAELDKTVVEKIGDPLMHLVRNAIDHGIEPAGRRRAAGKPERGTVSLNAYHDSGSIVIEVSDDGGGLKKERIFAKAVERGLVEADRKLSDGDIYALIFEPGFSTAEQVTSLSGRGVGMDVVKRNINALRGSVGIDSAEGRGTTVTVRLPLTLAIIDGFLVGLGKSTYVIPLDAIEECIEFAADPRQDCTNLRGRVLPFVRLRELFGVQGQAGLRESIVVLKHAGQRAGLVVDSLLGEFQTVIKPLSPVFSAVRCISGSTILGSGEVALILDVAALLQQSAPSPPQQQAA
ncbi:hypothetical protein ASC94_24185 [Massilia sp. Root418]|uniref:chemotaxis protein CheA n=1 Tax=Massilia sp. Root418 TaxID=1736532 RepID=UPI0006FEEDA8|nr:chemotaxis protein CheA [Massilia sp. Root418]KQW88517.1 hypothetical protein ASC94_24185 [Massilia sp. Root418]